MKNANKDNHVIYFHLPSGDCGQSGSHWVNLDGQGDYKNIFCFENAAKLKNFAKICKICKFRSTILNT